METYVARQPILKADSSIHAYELLFRNGNFDKSFVVDPDAATSSVLASSFYDIGIEELTSGKTAFVNFTRDLIIDEIPAIFPPGNLTVEILEDVEPDRLVIEAVKSLKNRGYTIALDDFIMDHLNNPLIKYADVIKIDFMDTTPENRKQLLSNIRKFNNTTKLLAEKVEIIEEYTEALNLGFDYFQGYYFSKPIIKQGRKIPPNKLNNLQLLSIVSVRNPDVNKIEKVVRQDISLTYKLLKFINSTFFSFKNEIKTIKHALNLMGVFELKKWISVICLDSMAENKTDELLRNSLIRAKMCETMTKRFKTRLESEEMFLLGMFSLLDAILDTPMNIILENLPISCKIKEALIEKDNDAFEILDMVISYDRADWKKFECNLQKFGVEKYIFIKDYYETLEWTNKVFSSVGI